MGAEGGSITRKYVAIEKAQKGVYEKGISTQIPS
jgi:hypothetical protein